MLVQFEHETRWKQLPDVPTARELATTAQDKALLELAELPFLMARPFMAPPDVPTAQSAILRKAFMDTQKDPEYLREAKQLQLDISPRSGDGIQNVVARIMRTPAALVTRYKDILNSK